MGDDETVDMNETLAAIGEVQSSRGEDPHFLLIALAGTDTGHLFPLEGRPLNLIGRDDSAHIKINDGEISRRHAVIRYDAPEGRYLLSDLNSRNGTRLNGRKCDAEHPLKVGDKIQLGTQTVLRVSLPGETETKYARKMQQAALRDGLTGAFNRRYLDERLVGEVAFSKRHKTPLTLMMLDLDHFKNINDTHGHRAGDHILRQFCEMLHFQVRAEDVVTRYGGEEFAVICRETGEERAAILAERLRAACETDIYMFEGTPIPVTVSIGVAGLSENSIDEPEKLIEAADQALYRAKSEGRNCWRLAAS